MHEFLPENLTVTATESPSEYHSKLVTDESTFHYILSECHIIAKCVTW